MSNGKAKKGFTLVELLVAVAIFAVFITAIMTLLVDMYRSSRRIILEEQIYQDLRAMMRQITIMVEGNAIDYEEYYRLAVGSTEYGEDTTTIPPTYEYGDYAKLFFDWGEDLGPGVYCNDDPLFTTPLEPGDPCEVIDKTTLDKNMGRNPATDATGTIDSANAFCGGFTGQACPPPRSIPELYLINENGDRKTFLAAEPYEKTVRETAYQENALSILWMNGSDTDGNDVPDSWEVAPEFVYFGNPAALAGDLSTVKDETLVFENFIPMSPLRTNIIDLRFYISPYEDPYKAFAETDPTFPTLVQPHVTVVMTVEPSASETQDYLGPIPQMTLQTTIYTQVRQNIRSY